MAKDRAKIAKVTKKLAKETYEEILNRLQKIELDASLGIETLKQRKYFVRGIALGLFYGIIGNIFASHYYGLFEGVTTRRFDVLLGGNLFILVIAFILIVIVSRKWLIQIKAWEKKEKLLVEMIGEARIVYKEISKQRDS